VITHGRTHAARFLGYEIVVLANDHKHDQRGHRSINGRIGLKVPLDVIRANGSSAAALRRFTTATGLRSRRSMALGKDCVSPSHRGTTAPRWWPSGAACRSHATPRRSSSMIIRPVSGAVGAQSWSNDSSPTPVSCVARGSRWRCTIFATSRTSSVGDGRPRRTGCAAWPPVGARP